MKLAFVSKLLKFKFANSNLQIKDDFVILFMTRN